MTFFGQIWHVAAKDLREARWGLGVYVLLVVVATAHATAWWSGTGISSSFWMLLVVPVALFSIAMVLQADAPLRSDAFWASRPFSPAAVLAAKLVMALLIVGIGTAGQFIALMAYDLSITDAAIMAVRSAGTLAMFVPLTLLLAAVSRDLKAFALAMVAVLVLGIARSAVGTTEVPSSIVSLLTGIRIAAGVGTALFLLAWMYRRRDVSVGHRLAACAAVLILLLAPPSLTPVDLDDIKVVGGPLPGIGTVSALDIPERTLGRNDLHISVHTDLPSEAFNARLELRRVTVHLRDSSFVADIQGNKESNLVWTGLPVIPRIRWVGEPGSRRGPMTVTVSLPAAQRALVGPAVDSVTVDGVLVTSEATVAATIPLVERTPIARQGRRFYIEDIAQDGHNAQVDVRTASVLGDNASDEMAFAVDFALVNRARGEGIALQLQQGQGNSGGLVFPGVSLRVHRSALSTDARSSVSEEPAVDAAWMANAELLAVKWVPRGRQPVRLTAAVIRNRPR